jgi:hypothetical protein
MQSLEETFFGERIAAIIAPLHVARHNRSLEDQMRVRDLAEIIAESTGAPQK